MITNPRINQKAMVWYRKSNQHLPYHGKTGTIVKRSYGKPRNHLIEINGKCVVVPCGNLKSIL